MPLTGLLAPATDLMAAPRYDDPRTANTGIPTTGGAYADMGAYEFVETAESNIDLVVSEVQGPLSVIAGETVTVTWTVRNQGPSTSQASVQGIESDPGLAIGPWHDSITLMTGEVTIPAGEALVAEGVTLAIGESRTFTAQVRVPGGVAGNYHWQVSTNSRGEVFEGRYSANNTAASQALVALDLPELVIGGAARSGLFSTTDESHWFKLMPAPNQDILVSLESAAGAAELYLGRGHLPHPPAL